MADDITELRTLGRELRVRKGASQAAYEKMCELNVELHANGKVAYWPSENEPGYFSAYWSHPGDGAFSCGAEDDAGRETPSAPVELAGRIHAGYRAWREAALACTAAQDRFDKAAAVFLEKIVEDGDG